MAYEIDWSGISGTAVEKLKAPKIVPVPAELVALAQRTYDGIDLDGVQVHVLRHTFLNGKGEPDVERAAAFAKLMRRAGDHTAPSTSVSVAVDPDNTQAAHVISWSAGKRRGRSGAAATAS